MKETGVVYCPQVPEQRGQDASPEPLEQGSAQREKNPSPFLLSLPPPKLSFPVQLL